MQNLTDGTANGKSSLFPFDGTWLSFLGWNILRKMIKVNIIILNVI